MHVAVHKNKLLVHERIWINLPNIMQSEGSLMQEYLLYGFIYTMLEYAKLTYRRKKLRTGASAGVWGRDSLAGE